MNNLMIVELDLYPYFAEEDLKNVSEWLDKDIENINFEFEWEDINKFKKQIEEMENVMEYELEDLEKVENILSLLQKEEIPYAIFVNKSDNFILEGRHRIVAFHLFGMKLVPIYYVSIGIENV
jgi:hypothetical protein